MDFRKELQNIEGDITAEEFLMLTILSIKSKVKKEQRAKISKIKFFIKKAPAPKRDTISAIVFIENEEIIILNDIEIAMIGSIMLGDLAEKFKRENFNFEKKEDCLILSQYPSYW